KVNVANEAEVADGMGALLTEFGRVDTVVANAGIGRGSRSFHEMTLDTWRTVNAVNAEGLFFTFREACKHMVERAGKGDPGGSLIGISSLSAIDGAARNQAYAGTKGAVLSIIRGIAVEYGRYGIRANSIAPGWIATDMTAGAQGSDVFNSKVI